MDISVMLANDILRVYDLYEGSYNPAIGQYGRTLPDCVEEVMQKSAFDLRWNPVVFMLLHNAPESCVRWATAVIEKVHPIATLVKDPGFSLTYFEKRLGSMNQDQLHILLNLVHKHIDDKAEDLQDDPSC